MFLTILLTLLAVLFICVTPAAFVLMIYMVFAEPRGWKYALAGVVPFSITMVGAAWFAGLAVERWTVYLNA